jgi:hypothetical protein
MSSIQAKISKLAGYDGLSYDEKMYVILLDDKYKGHPYEYDDLGEDMSLINRSINGWWKPRFLINHETKCAYEFMDSYGILNFVESKDINWKSIAKLDEELMERAKCRYGHFPVLLRRFNNGVGMVEWQLNPDGRYYMDDDGFGMTDDIEVSLFGYINKRCEVVVPFTYIKGNGNELERMRLKAEKIVLEK